MQRYTDQTFDPTDFRLVLNAIHSGPIKTFIDSLLVNGVLTIQIPHIAKQELELPREAKVSRVQLRSGYYCRLNSYLSRIDLDISKLWLACKADRFTLVAAG